MSIWTKKASIEMVDAAMTRKAVLAVAEDGHAKIDRADWNEVWQYAVLRFNRLPDDGTRLVEPGWRGLKAVSAQSVRNWREGQPGARSVLTRVALRDIIRTAMPYVVGVKSVTGETPAEFQDWLVKGKMVDLHFEQLPLLEESKEISADTLIGDFLTGGVVAICKGGKWFLMSVKAGDLRELKRVAITVEEVVKNDTRRFYKLPDDWEQKVSIVDMESQE